MTADQKETPDPASGFSLIEVLVAVLLFSLLALSISASLTNLLRVDTSSERLNRATVLAQNKLEELSAGFGARNGSDTPQPGFSRTWSIVASHPPGSTARAEVRVSWLDPQARTISLATLFNE